MTEQPPKMDPYDDNVIAPTTKQEKSTDGVMGLNKRAVVGVLSILFIGTFATLILQSETSRKGEKKDLADQVQQDQAKRAGRDAKQASKQNEARLQQAQREAEQDRRKKELEEQAKMLEEKEQRRLAALQGPRPKDQLATASRTQTGAAPQSAWAAARQGYEQQNAQNYYADLMAARKAPMFYSSNAKSGDTKDQDDARGDDRVQAAQDRLAQLRQQRSQGTQVPSLMGYPQGRSTGLGNQRADGMSPGRSTMGSSQQQSQFAASGPTEALSSARSLPQGTAALKLGTIIHAVLETGLNSQLPGVVVARISQPVWNESMTRIVLPAGARLVGAYNAQVEATQTRAQVVWNTLVLAGQGNVVLPNFPGVDLSGGVGYESSVDNHFDQLLIAAGVGAVFSASAAALAGPTNQLNVSPGQQAIYGAAQPVQKMGETLGQKYAQAAPTLSLRAGTQVGVLVTQDVALSARVGGAQ